MKELIIKDLHVSVEDKEILKGVNLTINANETIALLGPNGHGKSTLLAAIMGNPKYKVTQGSITLDGEDVLAMKVDERARKGVFLAMQYPSEVPGVVNADFLKAAINARRENPIKLFEFYRSLESASKKMHISMDMAQRFLNEGFSGGEKKRNEILQMLLFNPDLSCRCFFNLYSFYYFNNIRSATFYLPLLLTNMYSICVGYVLVVSLS